VRKPSFQIDSSIIAAAANAELPDELTDPQRYIQDVNSHIEALLSDLGDVPDTMPWDVVTPAYFAESTKNLPAEAKLGAFWLDMTNQARIYCALSGWKWESMASSLTRALGAKELISPPLLARSMMELSASVLAHVHEALGVFRVVASSERPVIGDAAQTERLEEMLNKAIWGSRIGTTKLADGAALWTRSPYPEGQVQALNILTSFQKLVREIPDVGATAYKVYEWLCDIVHPATQGMRVFWEDCRELRPGHRRFSLQRQGKSDLGLVHAITLWGTGFSAVLMRNTLRALLTEIVAIDARLATVYKLPCAGRVR
jgi:hypothetical protein